MKSTKKQTPFNKYLKSLDKATLAKVTTQFRSGQNIFGENGVFGDIFQNAIQNIIDAEMEAHLDKEERSKGNKRNGKKQKYVRTSGGSFKIDTPQDRHSTFTPQIVKKRETIIADKLEKQILSLYGIGMSYRDMSEHIKTMYDYTISPQTIQHITDRLIPKVQEWQNRQIDDVYTILWLDAMHYKIKEGHSVCTKALYNVIGLNRSGKKELIGVYIAESEGAKFWMRVLSNLQNRGLKDVLIVCVDNLKGFPEAISSIFPKAHIQHCVVHQIRNSLKYIPSKDQKKFMVDLKKVYRASSKEAAESKLEKLSGLWEEKYPAVLRSWRNNWATLSTYFEYPEPIRRIIYTTNVIEAAHRKIRQLTKTKGAFPNNMALLKLVYLAADSLQKKWEKPIQNWGLIAQQLAIYFGDRMPLDLNY